MKQAVCEDKKLFPGSLAEGLEIHEVMFNETNLTIMAEKNLYDRAITAVVKYHGQIGKYILEKPDFQKSFHPVHVSLFSPKIIRNMAGAAKHCGVGPMAAVAGAISEMVGLDLDGYSKELIIGNGGSHYIKTKRARTIGICAGTSPLSGKIALEIGPEDAPFGISISSGTSGSAFSFGKADAVCVIARSAALADADATAIGNVVQDIDTVSAGIKAAKKIRGLSGVLIIKEDRVGIIGRIRIVQI